MMKERLIALINHSTTNERTKNKEFSELTGLSKEVIRALAYGRQKFNEEHIRLITAAFPQYKMWFVFGQTEPETEQTSPELEGADSDGETGADMQ